MHGSILAKTVWRFPVRMQCDMNGQIRYPIVLKFLIKATWTQKNTEVL